MTKQEPARTVAVGTPNAPGSHAARLLALGRRLDAERLHSIAIIETNDGYIARASHPSQRRPVLLEAPLAQPPTMQPPAPPPDVEAPDGMPLLYRNGYATALHALGQRLDRQQATAVAISEGEHFVAVSLQPAGSNAAREELFLAGDLAQLIAQAQKSRVPLRLRADQAAAQPETSKPPAATNPRSAYRAPARRQAGGPRMSHLRRLALRLANGLKQQPGG